MLNSKVVSPRVGLRPNWAWCCSSGVALIQLKVAPGYVDPSTATPLTQTGQDPCRANFHTWGLVQSTSCDCGQRQTMNHAVDTCPLTTFEGGLNLLYEVDDDGWNLQRLQHTQNKPGIAPGLRDNMPPRRWVRSPHISGGRPAAGSQRAIQPRQLRQAAWAGTDRQTDGRIAVSLNAPYMVRWFFNRPRSEGWPHRGRTFSINFIIVKKLNSLKHLVRTNVAESHN